MTTHLIRWLRYQIRQTGAEVQQAFWEGFNDGLSG
jgi:hypothetical protein